MQRSPIIVLSYAHGGAGYLQQLLSRYGTLACTSGTGLLPLCEAAATAWEQVENRDGPMSSLAINSIRAMTTGIITTALAGTGRRRWCEIAFAHPRCAEIFMRIHPSANFICLHRSCMEVVHAGVQANPWGLARSVFQPFTVSYPGNAVAAIAAYWAATTESLLEFEQAHPDNCHRVRYEDLLCNPGQADAEISSFLSLGQSDLAMQHLINDELPYSTEEDQPSVESLIPLDWIPSPLMRLVNQLMVRLGYQAIPGSGRPSIA
jgi:protein-tyrosine sulfotransferase